MNKESNETQVDRIGLKMREKSLFGNQPKSAKKFGETKEFSVHKTLITHLNVI